MKVILNFDYYSEPDRYELPEIEISPKFLPAVGEFITYEFNDNSGDDSFEVKERSFYMNNGKIERVTLFLCAYQD